MTVRYLCSNIIMGNPKGSVRMRWSLDCIKCFLEACIHEVTKVGRKEGSLHIRSWKYVQKQLQEVCNLKVTQKQMKNTYDYLKWKFLGWAYLKRKVGNLYNSKTNTFNLTEEEWRDFIKVCLCLTIYIVISFWRSDTQA